jgi:predicted aconitase with swiveling domain
LAELIRTDLGPIAIVLAESDVIIALGAIVGSELYGKQIPILKLEISALESLQNDEIITVDNLGDRGVIRR